MEWWNVERRVFHFLTIGSWYCCCFIAWFYCSFFMASNVKPSNKRWMVGNILFFRCWTKCEYIYICIYCQPLIGELEIHDMKFMKHTLTFSSQSCLLKKKKEIHSLFPSRCRCIQLGLLNTNGSFSAILCLVDISYLDFLLIQRKNALAFNKLNWLTDQTQINFEQNNDNKIEKHKWWIHWRYLWLWKKNFISLKKYFHFIWTFFN